MPYSEDHSRHLVLLLQHSLSSTTAPPCGEVLLLSSLHLRLFSAIRIVTWQLWPINAFNPPSLNHNPNRSERLNAKMFAHALAGIVEGNRGSGCLYYHKGNVPMNEDTTGQNNEEKEKTTLTSVAIWVAGGWGPSLSWPSSGVGFQLQGLFLTSFSFAVL